MAVAVSYAKDCSNGQTKKEFTRKLKIYEYVLEIDRNDIIDVELTYSFDYVEESFFKDGQKIDVVNKPIITIGLSGKDKDGNDAWICFDLKTDINYLNTLTNVPTDITSLLSEGEAFIKKPLEKLSGFLDFDFPKNTEDDIYKNLTSLWISKIKDNEFIMKLSVSTEVFTYFKIILDNN